MLIRGTSISCGIVEMINIIGDNSTQQEFEEAMSKSEGYGYRIAMIMTFLKETQKNTIALFLKNDFYQIGSFDKNGVALFLRRRDKINANLPVVAISDNNHTVK